MNRLILVFLFITMPTWADPTPTQTPTIIEPPAPTPTRAPHLGPGPIVSLWRALPNPVSGSQQIRIANVGDAWKNLGDCSISTESSSNPINLKGFLGPGETAFINLPNGTLDLNGDFIRLGGGGAIYQGIFEGPVPAGQWIHINWANEASIGVRLYKILPNSSANEDATGEAVWVKNRTSSPVSLEGWIIRNLDPDEKNQDIPLSGSIAPGEIKEFINPENGAIFNNDEPDCIALLDASGKQVDCGTYPSGVDEDEMVSFIRPCN